MITATDLGAARGSRILLDDASFRVGPGRPDRAGRPQRRGQDDAHPGSRGRGRAVRGGHSIRQRGVPAAGSAHRRSRRPGPDRILSARGLDEVVRRMRDNESAMASADHHIRDRAMARYVRVNDEFLARGGYASESEAAAIASSLGLPDRVLGQPLHTLSGGQRRRVELARILFSGAERVAAARRADEPPRRRLRDVATGIPCALTRAGSSSSHTMRRCCSTRSTGCSTSMPLGRCSTSTTSDGRRTYSSARSTSVVVDGNGAMPRSRRRR